MLSSKDVVCSGSVGKGADRADGLDELRVIGLEGLSSGVTGSQGICQARLHEGVVWRPVFARELGATARSLSTLS